MSDNRIVHGQGGPTATPVTPVTPAAYPTTVPAAVPVQGSPVVDGGAAWVSTDPVTGERVVTREAAPVAAPVVAPVATTVVAPAVATSDVMVSRTWNRFSVSQVIHGLCGIVLLVLGALAVAQGGFQGTAASQTSQVFGLQHTTVLGLVELAFGLLLVIAALTPSGRPFGGFVGVLLLVAGLVLVAGSDQLLADLHTERGLGWVALVLGVLSIVGAFMPERLTARRTAVGVR